MHVICCRNDYAVDVLLTIKHLAIIPIAFRSGQLICLQLYHPIELRLRLHAIKLHGRLTCARFLSRFREASPEPLDVGIKAIERFAGVSPIHVAERHDILACEIDQIRAAHSTNANSGNVQCIARWSESLSEHIP